MEEFNKIPNDSIENNLNDKTLLIENLDISVVIEFFRQMERQGPGSDEVTLRAFRIIEELIKEEKGYSPSAVYKIADMGCGTGGQSMTLARNSSALITAFDIFPGMIETLNRRVRERGLLDRVRGVVASMDNIPPDEIPSGNFPGDNKGFDIIWSEGSIYHIGFENGLKLWREYLRDGGYIAVSEMVWLTEERPLEFEKYLSDNVPEISLPSAKIRQIESAGYTPVASFLFPWSCWSETYLRPMEGLFDKFLDSQNHSDGAREFVKRQREEIYMFEKYREYFGYNFLIMRDTSNKILRTTIRKTNINELHITENLTREAFWNLYKPGCDEHLALHQLRQGECYIPDLDLVALLDGQIVGHIISTGARVVPSGTEVLTTTAEQHAKSTVNGEVLSASGKVLCLGPVSAHPSLQGRGIGSQLIRQTIASATGMGFKAIILYGDPAYYGRFGFVNAQKYGISTRDNKNFDPFMALELYPGALDGISGQFFEDDRFFTTEEHLEEFEKHFPVKEKGEPRIALLKFPT